MVAGRLAEKNGYFYIVLSYNGPDGKRVQKWQGTGLPVKGNKKKADELLRQARRSFTPPVPNRSDDLNPDMPAVAGAGPPCGIGPGGRAGCGGCTCTTATSWASIPGDPPRG